MRSSYEISKEKLFSMLDVQYQILKRSYTKEELDNVVISFTGVVDDDETYPNLDDKWYNDCVKMVKRYKLGMLQRPVKFDHMPDFLHSIIEKLKESVGEKPIFIGLSGASGTGKTSLTKILTEKFGYTVVSLDNYLVSSRGIIDGNFDDYRLIDFALLQKNLIEFLEKGKAEIPIYDFSVSKRSGYEIVHVPDSKVIILEGTHSLNEKICRLYDLRVVVDSGAHFGMIRRIIRDGKRTGQTCFEIFEQIVDTVFCTYKAYIAPTFENADIFVANEFNTLLYPSYSSYYCSLKSDVIPTKEVIESVLGANNYKFSFIEDVADDIYMLAPEDYYRENNKKKTFDWVRLRSPHTTRRYNLEFSQIGRESTFTFGYSIKDEMPVRFNSCLLGMGYKTKCCLKKLFWTWKCNNVDLEISICSVKDLKGKKFVTVRGPNKDIVKMVADALGVTKNLVLGPLFEKCKQFYMPMPLMSCLRNNIIKPIFGEIPEIEKTLNCRN